MAADTISPDEVTWDDVDIDVMKDENVVNILLIGQDRRAGEGGLDEERKTQSKGFL